jgi:hypothetical protein
MVQSGNDLTHQPFLIEQRTPRPPLALPPDPRLNLTSTSADESGVRRAVNMAVLSPAPQPQEGTQTSAPPPQAVKNVEQDIEGAVRRWRLGIRAGVALDPELISFGVQSRIGPFFNRNLTFRPSAEFSWGEVTDMIGVNADVAYRIPISDRSSHWSPYFGGGPAFNFIHRGFEERDIDFGNLEYDTALNLFGGMEFKSGTFVEVRAGVYAGAAPTFRLVIGHNF